MKLYAIAINTFREAVRNKILYTILVFALFMIMASIAMGAISVGQPDQIIMDFGIASISVFSILISVFLGIGLVSKEIEKKTVYTIVTKPISRFQFLLGKAMGLFLTVFVIIAVMTLELYAVVYFSTGKCPSSLIVAPLSSLFESLIIISFALMFSSFTTQILASIFTISIYVVGQLSWGLKLLQQRVPSEPFIYLIKGVYFVLPQLHRFNFRSQIVYSLEIDSGYVILVVLYSMLYSCSLILLASIIFERKDLV